MIQVEWMCTGCHQTGCVEFVDPETKMVLVEAKIKEAHEREWGIVFDWDLHPLRVTSYTGDLGEEPEP